MAANKQCPLMKDRECLKEQCGWWFEKKHKTDRKFDIAECIMITLVDTLDSIVIALEE